MSNVVDLAAHRGDRIIIEKGTLKSADPDLHGRQVFFLEFQAAGGGSLIMWQGESLREARRLAAEHVAEGAVLSDRTGMPA